MKKLLIATAALFLAGCSRSPGPEGTVKTFLDSLKAADVEKAKTLIQEGEGLESLNGYASSFDGQAMYKAVWSNMTYEVGKAQEGRQQSTYVPVTLKTVDTLATLRELAASVPVGSRPSPAEIAARMNAPTSPKRETSLEFYVSKNDAGVWKIWPTDAVNMALKGNPY